jgi:nitrogen fixation protein NifQ
MHGGWLPVSPKLASLIRLGRMTRTPPRQRRQSRDYRQVRPGTPVVAPADVLVFFALSVPAGSTTTASAIAGAGAPVPRREVEVSSNSPLWRDASRRDDQIFSAAALLDGNEVALERARTARSNARLLRSILDSQRQGRSCLPFFLGMTPLDCICLLQQLVAPEPVPLGWVDLTEPRNRHAWKRGALRQELLELRRDEWQELRELLLAGRRGLSTAEVYLADIIAAACLGGDHLWRDLGLANRQDLRELLMLNFPALATLNVRDMKWKKFFYKQLCEQEGGYVCRSPTCEACAVYADCFGPET